MHYSNFDRTNVRISDTELFFIYAKVSNFINIIHKKAKDGLNLKSDIEHHFTLFICQY